MRRLLVAVVLLLGLSLVPSQVPVSQAAAPQSGRAVAAAEVDAPVPVLDWRPCWDEQFECATADVPLDYDDPTGTTTRLHVLRVPAGDQANKIGSLFVNPGGPGGTSTDFAAYFPILVDPEISERFDIVGIDPRGVSRPLMRCVSDQPQPEPYWYTPSTPAQARKIFAVDAWVRDGCRREHSPITAHMSTADTARDMDLIRQALGEEQLTYYGISYGTYLGATYAAMFPDRVRAMIVDAVLDPIAWSRGINDQGSRIPFSTRLRSGYGAYDALTSAFTECDRAGRPRCALAGRAAVTWHELLSELRRHPVKGLPWRAVVDATLGYLYVPDAYPILMRDIKRLHRQVMNGDVDFRTVQQWRLTPTARRVNRARGVPDRIIDRVLTGGPYSWWGNIPIIDPFHGVSCADTDNPTDPWAWWREGNKAETKAPWFTMTWTFASSTCAQWPSGFKADRFTGPFRVTTSAPILVVGNSHDPATPISGARTVNRIFTGSRLLIMDGWGHGALQESACVDAAWRDYLIDGTLPPAGKVCKPNHRLFPS